MGKKSILIVVLILVILGAVIGKNFFEQSRKTIVETNDLASESEIEVEILYKEASEDKKEQKSCPALQMHICTITKLLITT